MAALTGASQSPTHTDLQCLLHIDSVRFETVKPLKNIRWTKVASCAKEWLNLSGRDSEIAGRIQHMGLLDEGLHYDQACVQQQNMMGFHDTCYRRFVDSKRIVAAKKRTVPEETPCDLTAKKRRKRSSQPSRSSGVLPVQCIICWKRNSFITRRCKRVEDKLQQAETFDGGLLRQAAERKRDEHILMHIRGKDCVAIEVRYHSLCYKNYIRFLTRKTETDPERGQLELDYQVAYGMFCGTIVQPRLIDNEEIMRMTKLVQLFVLKIKEHEGADLQSYRSDKLKYRLKRDYPQLCFHKPFRRYKCQIVYTDALSPGSVMETLGTSEDSSTATSEVEMDTPTCSFAVTGQDSMRMLYNAGMILKNAIKQSPGLTCPWPPTSRDLTLDYARELVPLELFNLMAWCTGATEEPCLKTVADVSCKDETNILSLCQDIIYAASNGRKQTPKSLSLGLTVRHLTGSSQMLRLLNNFGHCSSWDTIIGLETSLAQLQLATSHKVLKGFLEKAPTVLVWDNIDFGEETVSGHGTTHHTNGIMIQSHITEQTELNDRPKIKKGVRSLTHSMTPMETFISVGRKGPKLVGDATLVNSSLYSPAIRSALQKDFIFLLSKFLDGKSEVPGWTGFNISLAGRMTLQKSAIHYLPVIEASPTEMTTINTIIHRSLSIADNLQLEHICLVFDQAIYAKVQQIRWSRDDVMKRTVVRLGELHTCMSYMGIIGKRFGDAGLRDLLIESEVVAAGSINGVLSGHHYNRSVHSHKLMYEALQRMQFSAFKDTLTEEEVQKYSSLLHPGDVNVKDIQAGSPELSYLMACYDKFVTRKNSESPTFALWSSYIDMVQLLLVFIRATCESDWHMHLAAIRFMMPWFFAYDRTNYSRYLPPYWVEMVNLPTTHPRCYEHVSKRGEWTVQRQDRHPFASIACDQAIEQTCNRDSKTRGGITSFTLNRGAVQRWILSQPERSAVTRQCELLSGLGHHGRLSKELDSARTKRDGIAVDSIISTVNSMINPFDCSTEYLVGISYWCCSK